MQLQPSPLQHTLNLPQQVMPEPPGHFVQFCASAVPGSTATASASPAATSRSFIACGINGIKPSKSRLASAGSADRTGTYCHTKYGWIYIIRETQNDNLTSDPPSAVILEYRTAVRPEIEVDL
eukprot:COSAG06_NODE_3194_length_5704_cov_3.321677_4_plen_123_part_00